MIDSGFLIDQPVKRRAQRWHEHRIECRGFAVHSASQERSMPTSYGAICTDFYVNQKLSLKMDLPSGRESVLDMFDRIRKELPDMERFRRYDGELALESPEQSSQYSWLAL